MQAPARRSETIHVSQRGGFGRTLIDARRLRLRPHSATSCATATSPPRSMRASRPQQLLECCTVDTHRSSQRRRLRSRSRHAGTTRHDRGKTGRPCRRHTRPTTRTSRYSDYGQHAIIAEVTARPGAQQPRLGTLHRRTARSPCCRSATTIRWYSPLPPDKAERLLGARRRGLLAALQPQFGPRIDFVSTGPRAAIPLALRMRPADHATTASVDRQLPHKPCTRFPARASTSACATPGNWPKCCSNPCTGTMMPGTRRCLAAYAPLAPRPPRQHGFFTDRHRPPLLQRHSPRSNWPAASACSPSISPHRSATSSPNA